MIRRWFMISCRQAQVLLSERQDGVLPLLDRARLRIHLKACEWCSRVARQFRFLSDAVRRLER
jgi:predicted anti-sigma-YlaC factor YlaD